MGQIVERLANIECILAKGEKWREGHDGSPGSGILLRGRSSLSAG